MPSFCASNRILLRKQIPSYNFAAYEVFDRVTFNLTDKKIKKNSAKLKYILAV